MDLAIKEIKSRIDYYDFHVRDCSPNFKESKEKYEKRLNELKGTLEQLKRVLEIILHESSGLNIAGVVGQSEQLPCAHKDAAITLQGWKCCKCGELIG